MDNKRREHFAMQLRLKPAVGDVLEELAAKMQIPKTGVITTALLELAERKGITLKEEVTE